jgi:hypothetical protein
MGAWMASNHRDRVQISTDALCGIGPHFYGDERDSIHSASLTMKTRFQLPTSPLTKRKESKMKISKIKIGNKVYAIDGIKTGELEK